MIGIVELLKLSLKVWLAVNASTPFKRLHEIDREILRLSVGANESAMLQIEALGNERAVIFKLIGSLYSDLSNKP